MALFILLSPVCGEAADSRYFELRIYDVTPQKLDPVLARFRDHIGRLRRKHEIETLGYWTATNSEGQAQFVYLIAGPDEAKFRESEKAFGADSEFREIYAASEKAYGKTVEKIARYPLAATPWSPALAARIRQPARAFELRLYDVVPGQMGSYLTSCRDDRLRFFQKHGFDILGCWTGQGQGRTNQFVILLAHKDAETITASKQAYHADPEWKSTVDAWNKRAGQTTLQVNSLLLIPTPFSPMQ